MTVCSQKWGKLGSCEIPKNKNKWLWKFNSKKPALSGAVKK